MRTTITFPDDVAAEMERLRREQGLGPSEAITTLARRGMAAGASSPDRFEPPAPRSLGARIDYTNIGDVLALLDEEEHRA